MATIAEIRSRLIQGGMEPLDAQQAAKILADLPPLPEPTGGIWDTLKAKGFRISSRPLNTIFRLLTNDTKILIVMTKDGLNSLFAEIAIETLP